MLLVIAIFIVLAALAPILGSDSRDGLDWTPDNFWLRRRSGPHDVKRTDSREPACAGLCAADGSRTAPVAG
jgi:hypothetical protein